MRDSGQRQDVTFLALALVVLVVAIALFVGMKSIPKGRPAAGADDVQEEAAGEEAAAPAEGAGDRDPFRSPLRGGRSAAPQSVDDLKLVGIVTGAGERPRAVIHSGKRRYFAQVGDRAAGYTVTSIGVDSAVLERNGDRITLVLREPEPEE